MWKRLHSDVSEASQYGKRQLRGRFTLAMKCDAIAEVNNGCTASEVASIYGADESNILMWLKSASALNKRMQEQWNARTVSTKTRRTKYITSAKYVALMDYEATQSMVELTKKHGVHRSTLARWLREANHIKQQYFNDKRQQTNNDQHQPDDTSSTHTKPISAVEQTTNALSRETTADVCLPISAALPDDSDGGMVLSDHKMDLTSPVQLDDAAGTDDVITSVYFDAYKLCRSIQEMMALHGITMDDINTDAM